VDGGERLPRGLDPETGLVEDEATAAARQPARSERLARGKSWDDFEQDWSRLRPCEEALAYFGSWPEGRRGSLWCCRCSTGTPPSWSRFPPRGR
jgi:hypothetical protein